MDNSDSAWKTVFQGDRRKWDTLDTRPETWDVIRSRMHRPRRISESFWRVAAAVMFVSTCVLLFQLSRTAQPPNEGDAAVVAEFVRAEAFYQQQFAQRIVWLEQEGGAVQAPELQRLQAMYELLRSQWEQSPSEALRDALLLNLIMRLEAAERELDRLHQQRNDTQY